MDNAGQVSLTEQTRVEMMSGKTILWRCLHTGVLTADALDGKGEEGAGTALEFRTRNGSLLRNLSNVYGSCAVVSRVGDVFIGHLRFYPRAVCEMSKSGLGMCLQQAFPYGPPQDFGSYDFPPLEKLKDRTLLVHCMMLTPGRPGGESYRRKGIGTRMACALIEWARTKGWQAIQATAYEDLPVVFQVTGQTSRAFWEKIGFRLVRTEIEPALEEESDFVRKMREEAGEKGLDLTSIKKKYIMRLDLR